MVSKIKNVPPDSTMTAHTKLSTTTLPQVGRAVAKLLELPTSVLEQYKNNFVYINSFNVSQIDMLRALEKATGTTEKDWEVTKILVNTAITQGREEVAKGNRRGMIDVLYGMNFKPGMGGCFEEKIANHVLGLQGERLEDVVAGIVRQVEMS